MAKIDHEQRWWDQALRADTLHRHIVNAAQRHGRKGDPDDEVFDLCRALYDAVFLMTPEQLKIFAAASETGIAASETGIAEEPKGKKK